MHTPSRIAHLAVIGLMAGLAGCASSRPMESTTPFAGATRPDPDPRIGLAAGVFDAGQAIWNMRLVSTTPPPEPFVGSTNSDLAFSGDYVIQGNYRGFQIWDVSNPAAPRLVSATVCPGAQGDVSVYRNLLFVSTEYLEGRVDCGTERLPAEAHPLRLRGIRIFDISDPANPRHITNVQTCRGSHTHSILVHPNDPENVYVYVSGSAPVRPAEELAGCSGEPAYLDPNTTLFRIEIIRVPLANPEQAAVVNAPSILAGLAAPPLRSPTPAEQAQAEARRRQARAMGTFTAQVDGVWWTLAPETAQMFLDSIVQARGGSGPPTAADSAALDANLVEIITARLAAQGRAPREGPDQCHDITLFPAIGLAGGACEGYGILLDITDPVNPRRIAAVADTNFSYWHSANFSNDGTKVLFTDEWGGGGQPRCRATDPMEWGADAIFSIVNGELVFRSYYKLPVAQSSQENCVAHNGSIIPVPGRDIMVQAWYQGGVSVFDWTDPDNPFEIAFFDRGPAHPERVQSAGSWSAYWHNGLIYSSEMARGLDVLELLPSEYLTQNEIDAAKTVRFDQYNVQMQQRFVWPPSFPLARAYVDQLERNGGLRADRIAEARQQLAAAEAATGQNRARILESLADRLDGDANSSSDPARVRLLVSAVRDLAAASQ